MYDPKGRFLRKETVMATVGSKVRLVKDEGLDTPTELQGKGGVVIEVHSYPNRAMKQYTVQIGNQKVLCEHYHIETVAPRRFTTDVVW